MSLREHLDACLDESATMRALLRQVLEEMNCPGWPGCAGGRERYFPRWCAVCRVRSFLERTLEGSDANRLKAADVEGEAPASVPNVQAARRTG